ncbi:hypothetical protein LWI28_021442 [Acer negundo]|uniref:Uncharacterized protein n=1 Tax=Acer negundo TaxID=4023 RepID=A0AAD5I7Q2_ACENE|nr:hypothetical protein LWI28_021442 [Acer negundo]
MREACETLAAARSATRTNRLGRGSDGEHNGDSNTASIAMDRRHHMKLQPPHRQLTSSSSPDVATSTPAVVTSLEPPPSSSQADITAASLVPQAVHTTPSTSVPTHLLHS